MRQRLSRPYLIGIVAVVVIGLFLPLLAHSHTHRADDVQKVTYSEEVFIKKIAPDAQEIAKAYGMKPSMLIAQASLDSQFGQSLLASHYYNLFNVEASQGQAKVTLLDSSGKSVAYARYRDWKQSLYDYAALLKSGKVGSSKAYEIFVGAKSDKDWAERLEQARFSKQKNYAKKLMAIINTYKLQQFD